MDTNQTSSFKWLKQVLFLVLILLWGVGSVQAATKKMKPPTVLNENSAASLIKEALRSQRFMVSIVDIQPLMNESTTDYSPLPGHKAKRPDTPSEGAGVDQPQEPMAPPVYLLRRLIGERFVSQTVRVNSYPVISGTWEGISTCVKPDYARNPTEYLDYMLVTQNDRCSKNYLKLQLQPVPNSNRITGTSNRGGRASDKELNAIITPDNKIIFQPGMDGPQGSTGDSGDFTYIERGVRAYLVSSWNLLYTGVASGKRIEVKTYSYSFIPEVVGAPQQVIAGSFEVGAVSNLLLTIETRSTANFTWRVSLDRLGQVMVGETNPSGIGTAHFAKKPDGTWVLVPPLRFSE